jgi:hypothetical protein
MSKGKGSGSSFTVLAGGRSGKYDEAEFLVGGKGTGSQDTDKQSFKLYEGYIAQADRIMRSTLFPYKTLSDLYRHAVVRHIHWLDSLEPDQVQGSVLHQLRQIDEIVAAEEFQVAFISSIERTRKMVRTVIQVPGGKAHAGRVLRRLRKQIDLMASSFWKSYYEKMFLEEFGHYLNDDLVLVAINGQGDGEDEDALAGIPRAVIEGVDGLTEPEEPEGPEEEEAE